MNKAERIRERVYQAARELGRPPRPVTDDEILPETALLDSAGILELVLWVETEFDIEVPQDDFTLDNLGSIRRMVSYIESRKA